MNSDILIKIGCVAAGVAAGSTATYFLTRKKIRLEAFSWADEEIKSVKDTYKLLRKEPPYDDPKTAAHEYMRRMDELQDYAENGIQAAEEAAEEAAEQAVEQAVEELDEKISDLDDILTSEKILSTAGYATEEEQTHNIFAEARQRWLNDEAAQRDEEPYDELKSRDPRPPFLISADEFFDDANDFDKITISYYEGDDTLADDREAIIPDIPGVVGSENLLKFGEDSDDKNTVYIRNERLQVDYEVVREEGDYAQIVLGLREMEEERDRRVKRMRDDE